MEKPSTLIVQIKLTLRVGKDDDLIEFFSSMPNYKRASMVKSAMRGGNISVVEVEEEGLDTLLDDLFF